MNALIVRSFCAWVFLSAALWSSAGEASGTNGNANTPAVTEARTNAVTGGMMHEPTLSNSGQILLLGCIVLGFVALAAWVWREMKQPGEAAEMVNVRRTSLFFLPAFLAGFSAVLLYFAHTALGTALMWAVAWFCAGTLLGFIFGIPKSTRDSQPPPPPAPPQSGPSADKPDGAAPAPAPAPNKPRYETNNNLAEVSDWLTKIIVGLGLINLKQAPHYLRLAAETLRPCFGENCYLPFGISLIVGFSSLGFLFGNVFTRLFLARAIADADPSAQLPDTVKELGIGGKTKEGRPPPTLELAAVEGAGAPAPAALVSNDDPEKGKWGGQDTANGRQLKANIKAIPGARDLFSVQLTVLSTATEKPLSGYVVFHLHPSFRQRRVPVPVTDGVATLVLAAWGAFTVGAECDNNSTKLELDLGTVPGAPDLFRIR
jgi:hypothetical protein